MTGRTITTQIDIPASPGQVWDVLAEPGSYPQWNPFIVRLRGELVAGSAIRFSFRIPPLPALPGRATVLRSVRGRELRWAGRFLADWLMRAEHFHLLEEIPGGHTRLRHGEVFSGLLAGMGWPLIRHFAQPVYRRFNEALRERVARAGGAPR